MNTHKVTVFLLSTGVCASAFAALEPINKMKPADVVWSNANAWQNTDVTLPPNSNAALIANEWDTNSISVDGDFTVGKINANSDTGYKNNGVFTYKMTGTASGGANGSITVDVAQNTGAAIEIGINGKSTAAIYNQSVIFDGGTVNVIDSANPTRVIDIFVNSGATGIVEDYTKALTFTAQNTLNITHDVRFGTNSGGAQYRKMQMNLLGNTNIFGAGDIPETIAYKKVSFIGGDGNSAYTNAEYNIASAGTTFKSGSVTQGPAIDVNVGGTMNVYGSYEMQEAKGVFSNLNIAEGAKLMMTGAGLVDSEISFRASRSNINIAGDFTIMHSGLKAVSNTISNGSILTVKNGGKFTITSGNGSSDTAFSMNAGTTLIVEKGGLMTVKSQVRIYGDNTRIILKQENGLRSSEYGGKWKIVVGGNYDNVHIDFYANQDVHGIAFWSTATALDIAKLTFFLGDDVTSIKLEKLVADGGALNEFRFIEFENFRNNIFFVASKTDNDLLSQFSAEGYKDFYWEQTAGGWYLNAIQVPEPAALAAIFGALALGLAIYRRRK